MRILLLTQWFDPEPTVKGLPFAKELVKAGHDVQVITGFPNYPTGTLYPGFRIRPWRNEVHGAVRVTRVALYPSHDRSAVHRILNYASFAITGTIAGILTRFKPDVIYVYHPPLTVGLAGIVIGLVRRVPFVYDIQDLWPDTLSATGMIADVRVLDLLGRLANLVYRHATLCVVQSPGFMTRLIERGVPSEKLRLVYNWCDEDALSEKVETSALDFDAFDGRFNVVFAGNMGMAQGLNSVLAAAQLISSRNPSVHFVMIGSGTEVDSLRRTAQATRLRNVTFVDQVPMNEIGSVFGRADALLVHLRDSALFSITLPSKTQAYLFAGKPIIMAVPGDAADLVQRAGAGYCVPPEDPEALANAIVQMAALPADELAAMGRSGKRFYDETLSVQSGTAQMISAFAAAIAGHVSSGQG